mgnify:CR=1 FL=1
MIQNFIDVVYSVSNVPNQAAEADHCRPGPAVRDVPDHLRRPRQHLDRPRDSIQREFASHEHPAAGSCSRRSAIRTCCSRSSAAGSAIASDRGGRCSCAALIWAQRHDPDRLRRRARRRCSSAVLLVGIGEGATFPVATRAMQKLDAGRPARLRAGAHARLRAPGQRHHAADRRLADCDRRVARVVHRAGLLQPGLGRDLA